MRIFVFRLRACAVCMRVRVVCFIFTFFHLVSMRTRAVVLLSFVFAQFLAAGRDFNRICIVY